MKRRTLRRVATPFVMVLSAGCAKSSETGAPTSIVKPNDPVDAASSPTTAPTTAAPGALVYDGYGSCYQLEGGEKKYAPCPESLLPAPPTDRLVFKYAGQCKSVPSGDVVRCPEGGPTALIPENNNLPGAGGSIFLQLSSLKCFQGHDVKCPPKVMCNPPPPTEVPCPPALMPKLAVGTKPTKIDGKRCWFGDVEVACP